MSKKRPLKENNFDMGIAGNTGAIGVAPGWGTFSSPNVSQSPDKFIGSKSIGSNSNTTTDTPADRAALDAEINKIYSKNDTPSPDEILTGLKYELQHMIKKDKARAKEIVLGNLKQDPHYYGRLGMWNIDDKKMMDVTPADTTNQDPIQERIEILNKMLAAKGKKAVISEALKEALQQTREIKEERKKNR